MDENFDLEIRKIMQTPAFLESTEEERQAILRQYRDDSIKESPELSEYFNAAAQRANVEFLRSTGQGRYIPKNLTVNQPWQEEGWQYLSEDEKTTQIEQFRNKIPEFSKQDTLNQGDIEFFLNAVADNEQRKAKGEDTGWIADKAYRTWDGFAAGLAGYVGATELADKIRASTSENPIYDEDFTAQLFQGAGDMAASSVIFIGAALGGTAITGSPVAGGYLATTATLGTNSIARYNDGYQEAINKGLTEAEANKAGMYSLPGAAVDALGDKLIAGRFLPDAMKATFTKGTLLQKRELLADLVADTSKRGIIINSAKDAFTEGISEAVGDLTSGYGAYIATDDRDFIPKGEELAQSFLIGGVLGGTASGLSNIPKVVRNDHATLENTEKELERAQGGLQTDEQTANEVFGLLNEGKYKEAYDLSKQIETVPFEETSAVVQAEQPPTSDRPFLSQSEADDAVPFKPITPLEATTQEEETKAIQGTPESAEIQAENDAINKLKIASPELQQQFNDAVRQQFDLFTHDMPGLQAGLGVQPFAETVLPATNIRRGVGENFGYQVDADGFAQQQSARYNNLLIVPPGVSPTRGTADFSLNERDAPEGELQVQPSPDLQTKIQEAVALGRADNINYIAPVNSLDLKYLTDQGISKININSVKEREYQEPEYADEREYYIDSKRGLNQFLNALDKEYGENQWFVKDSQGAAGSGNYGSRQQITQAFDQQGELIVNGWYVEPKDPNLSNRQPGGDFRVHIVKRGGRPEVVPYATSARGTTLPFVVRTPDVLGIEEAALQAAEQANDSIAENGLLGVDVVIGADGQLFVPEFNPTQYGALAQQYGPNQSSGFIGTPYVQSAVYSHLAGRVPAFALAGRQIIRDSYTQARIAQGANFVAENIARMYGNARDANQLRGELVRTYGQQFGDKAEDLWNAFVESAGQITQRIIDIIQEIIDTISFRRRDTTVSPKNTSLMQKALADGNVKKALAKSVTSLNRAEEGVDTTPISYPTNGLDLLDEININSPFLNDLIGDNEAIRTYLRSIPVITSFENSFDGEIIRLTSNQRGDLETNEHELTHAVLEYGLRNNPEFYSAVDNVMGELRNALMQDQSPEGININSFLQKAKEDMRNNLKYDNFDVVLSRYINSNYQKLLEWNKRQPADKQINPKQFGVAYGFSSPHEFVAELFSNEYFRDYISKLDTDNRNVWQKIWDAIKQFFTGQVPKNSLDKAVDTVKKFVNDPKFDVQRKSFKDYVYKPSPVEKKRRNQLKQLQELKSHKIDDRFDSNTSSLLKAVKKLKPSQIDLLPPEERNRVYELIQNIHQARSQKAEDPESRINTSRLLDELEYYQKSIDSSVIQERIKQLDGVLDLSGYDGEIDDIDAFTAYINQLAENDKNFQDQKKFQSDVKKARFAKKMEAWRANYATIRREIQDLYPTAEDYLANYEREQGRPIKSQKLRDFMMVHYDYLTSLANVNAMEGGELYRHFFALNNLRDNSMMYGPETTVAYIKGLRDSKININSLQKKFRDPVINQGRGFLGGLDAAQRATETAQTQLERWSSFVEGKDFLQQDLMGPLLETIQLEAQNNESASLRKYDEAKKEFEKEVNREMSPEDRVTLAIASRLIQFRLGKDGDKEFRVNLANERQVIRNIIGGTNPDGSTTEGLGTESQQDEYRRIILPILDRLVDGLEESPNPMQQFIQNINERLGFGDTALGAARTKLLQSGQEILGEYTLDNKVISELFYKKPFKEYANYMPRLVIPINPEQYNAREGTIADEIEKFDDMQYQSNSFTSQPNQLKDRTFIGSNGHYSNNFEYILSRGIHVASLTSSTTAERHVLNERLKNGKIRDVINGSNSTYRVDQLQQWARQVMAHAMHSGQPLGTIGVVMKAINENFARVALSGIHQGVTQTISSYTDYQFRTGNIKGAMESALYYITNKKKMDEFFERNASWIGNRSFLGEQELDRRRNPSFDESKIRNHPVVKALSKFHDKAGEIITFSLRHGDDFSARTLVMAEYVRQLQQKNPTIKSINDVKWDTVEGNILSNSILDIEKNINASNKVTRGEFFVDRHRGMAFLRNVTVAFSSHVMMLAGQFNIAVRDLVDLHNNGGTKADKARAIRTIGAILGQTFSFSTSRYVINGAMAAAMVSLMRELYDDEEGKIAQLEERLQYARDLEDPVLIEHAEYELKAATNIRKQIDKFSQRQLGFSSYWKNAIKDELNSMHFLFNGPELPQKLVFPVFDRFGEMMMKEDQKERVMKMKARIKQLKENGQYGDASRLSEELILIENAEYLPWNIDEFGNIGMGGITGTALSGVYASIKELNDSMFGLTELNMNDFILSAQSYGIGQADLNRFFRTIDRIEDEQFTQGRKQQEAKEDAIKKQKLEEAQLQSQIDDAALREVLR